MKDSIELHQINRDFDNENSSSRIMTRWVCHPEHVASLLRHEYRFMRKEGTPRRVARWHVHRMLDMLFDGPGGWGAVPVADLPDELAANGLEEDQYFCEHCEAIVPVGEGDVCADCTEAGPPCFACGRRGHGFRDEDEYGAWDEDCVHHDRFRNDPRI